MIVDRDTEVFQYEGCKINKATISGAEGQALKHALDILGKTMTDGGTAPAVAMDTDTHYAFHQGVFTYNSSTFKIKSVSVVIDNVIEALFENSVTATDVEATDRLVTLSADLQYNSDADTLRQAINNGEKVAGSLVFTNGNQSLTFTFPALIASDEDPVVGGRGKIRYPLNLQALQSGTSKEIVVTHDSTA
ncbi:MAG: phage tail tube protein [Gimesia chilikensis]